MFTDMSNQSIHGDDQHFVGVVLSNREREALQALAKQLDISEEKVMILALRFYQLYRLTINEPSDSPGCGVAE